MIAERGGPFRLPSPGCYRRTWWSRRAHGRHVRTERPRPDRLELRPHVDLPDPQRMEDELVDFEAADPRPANNKAAHNASAPTATAPRAAAGHDGAAGRTAGKYSLYVCRMVTPCIPPRACRRPRAGVWAVLLDHPHRQDEKRAGSVSASIFSQLSSSACRSTARPTSQRVRPDLAPARHSCSKPKRTKCLIGISCARSFAIHIYRYQRRWMSENEERFTESARHIPVYGLMDGLTHRP